MSLFSRHLFPLAIPVVFAALVATPANAITVTVNVGGESYSITTFNGSYDQDSSRFTGTQMPWFGNSTLAFDLGTAVGDKLGLFAFGIYGPAFAHATTSNSVDTYTYDSSKIPPANIRNLISKPIETTYAVIAAPRSPVPGPLPLVGVAAAFGTSRCLRRRIKLRV